MYRATLAIGLAVLSCPALAQSQSTDLRGSTVTATDNVTLYNAPPNAILKRGQRPMAILNPGTDAPQVFPLSPSQQGYTVQAPNALPPGGFTITDQVDVVQSGQIQRWLELSSGAAGSLGWVACQQSTGDCTGLSPQVTED